MPVRSAPHLHSNGHALYAGVSGSGKSTAVEKMGLIKPTDQVVMWDMYGQRKGTQFLSRQVRTYTNIYAFTKALEAGRQTEQGFKIAYCPAYGMTDKKVRRKAFLQFCRVYWEMLDGLHVKRLIGVADEINRVTNTSGDEDSIYGEILEGSRQFGGVFHSISQRLQPIPNTIIAQSKYKWIGVQEADGDINRVAKEIGVKPDDIANLQMGEDLKKRQKWMEYYFKEPGRGNVTKGKFAFDMQ